LKEWIAATTVYELNVMVCAPDTRHALKIAAEVKDTIKHT